MAIAVTAVWRVRTGGADTNGGFYDTGGVDYSQQDAPQWSGVVSGDGADLIMDDGLTGLFTVDMIGNGINIDNTIHQIASFVDSNSIRIAGTRPAFSALNAAVGGGLGSLVPLSNSVTGNTIYVQTGSYSQNVDANIPAGGFAFYPGLSTEMYAEGGPVTVTATSGCSTIVNAGSGLVIDNFIFEAGGVASKGLVVGSYSSLSRIVAHGFSVYGIQAAIYSSLTDSEIYGGTGVAYCGDLEGTSSARLYIHDNAAGLYLAGGSLIDSLILRNGTGAGLTLQYGLQVKNCVIYGNTGSGINLASWGMAIIITDNVIVNNGAYGMTYGQSNTIPSLIYMNWNAFYNNTSGSYNHMTTGPNDVTLSGDPFTNAAGGDFTLNNTAGRGAACRGTGSSTNLSLGRYQVASGGGGGTTYVYQVME